MVFPRCDANTRSLTLAFPGSDNVLLPERRISTVGCQQGQCGVTKGGMIACDTRQGVAPCLSLEPPQEGGQSHCHYIPPVPPEQ